VGLAWVLGPTVQVRHPPNMATVLSAVDGPVAACVGAMGGVLEGVLILAFVTPERYRRSDEVDAPVRDRRWVPVWTVLACVAIAVSWRTSPVFMTILLVWMAPMVAACVVDVDVHRLPDVLTLSMFVVLAVCLAALAVSTSSWPALGRAFCAAAIVLVVFLLLGLVGGGAGMGMGDVKLSASIGLVMGYLSWVHVFFAVLAAALIGSVWGLGLRIVRGREASLEFAFGPHLVAGAQLVLVLPVVAGVWT